MNRFPNTYTNTRTGPPTALHTDKNIIPKCVSLFIREREFCFIAQTVNELNGSDNNSTDHNNNKIPEKTRADFELLEKVLFFRKFHSTL